MTNPQPHTAPQSYQELLNAGAALGEPKNLGPSSFAVIPPGFKLQDLEEYEEEPKRRRGVTTLLDADSFVKYVNEQKDEGTSLYGIKAGQPGFTAVFNDHHRHGDEWVAGWRDHKATYSCPLSREWKLWTGANKTQMKQADFAQFIEDNQLHIAPPESDAVLALRAPTMAQMVEIARTFEAKSDVAFKQATRLDNGAVQFKHEEKLEAKAGDKGQFDVPERFWIAIPVFEGGPRYEVGARFRYRLNSGALTLWFDLESVDKVLEHAVDEVWAQIAEQTSMTIFHGRPSA